MHRIADQRAYWNRVAGDKDFRHPLNVELFERHVPRDVRVLDLGCGDGRIGAKFLHAGPGYGGSCFPKDMQALIHTAQSLGYPPRLLNAAEAINFDQREKFLAVIKNYFHDNLKGKTLAGLSARERK